MPGRGEGLGEGMALDLNLAGGGNPISTPFTVTPQARDTSVCGMLPCVRIFQQEAPQTPPHSVITRKHCPQSLPKRQGISQ